MLSMDDRKKLPDIYEKRYKSENLKRAIADNGMWYLIPCVSGGMDSPQGIHRIKENDLLFTFIDQYFPDAPFAFEPYMVDGRFVFLPDNVEHQGMGVSVSKDLPGYLEICQFWYPSEFTQKKLMIDQLYVPVFSIPPCKELADMVRDIYIPEKEPRQHYCTFPIYLDTVVTLQGDFLDKMDQSANTIRRATKGKSPHIQKTGQDMIMHMRDMISPPKMPPIHFNAPQ